MYIWRLCAYKIIVALGRLMQNLYFGTDQTQKCSKGEKKSLYKFIIYTSNNVNCTSNIKCLHILAILSQGHFYKANVIYIEVLVNHTNSGPLINFFLNK